MAQTLPQRYGPIFQFVNDPKLNSYFLFPKLATPPRSAILSNNITSILIVQSETFYFLSYTPCPNGC